jgi:superfamily I DNA and/or RNA helicase
MSECQTHGRSDTPLAPQDALGGRFVVILDEASQMTEPSSLVPLLRAKAQ